MRQGDPPPSSQPTPNGTFRAPPPGGLGLDHHCATAAGLTPKSAKLALRLLTGLSVLPDTWHGALEAVLQDRALASEPLSGSDLMALTVMEHRFFDRVARVFENKQQREARVWLDIVIFDAALCGAASP